MSREITRADILALDDYAKLRRERRLAVIEVKRHRRVPVGPDVTFYFENRETMVQQIQEMLWIEKGGEAQIQDELDAYNPLVPNGAELVATMMIEIDDEVRRARTLATLGGIEETVELRIGAERFSARPETGDDVERTKADGKTSSIHFLRFRLTLAQIARFRDGGEEVLLSIGHANYGHMAILSPAARDALGGDFA